MASMLSSNVSYGSGNGGSTSTSSSSTNFAAGGEDALAILLQQLLSGGTDEQIASRQDRQEEITSARQLRADYSKESAFNDAALVVRQQQRKALEEILPSLVRSAEGAGTSKNAMRALMLQDAANKAAESSAAVGLKASVDYGNISSNLTNVLENLTRQDNPVTSALLNAINLSKGQSSTSTSTSNSGGNSSGNSSRQYNQLPQVRNQGTWDALTDYSRQVNNSRTSGGMYAYGAGFTPDSSVANTSREGISDSYDLGQSDFFDSITF